MRFFEFADAEAQLGLLRTIIDSTWSAIAKQAEEQKRAESQRKANAGLRPRKLRGGGGRSRQTATPKPRPAPAPSGLKPKLANPQPVTRQQQAQPIAQPNLAKPYNGAVPRLTPPPFRQNSQAFAGNNGAK